MTPSLPTQGSGRRRHGLVALGFAALVTSPVGGFAYDNDGPGSGPGPHGGGPHRALNAAALARFVREAKDDEVFRRYDFAPTAERYGVAPEAGLFFVDGTTVVQSGSWYDHEPLWPGVTATFIVEAEMSASFPWWVVEGGYTADEPESYMALRHFYDPRKRSLDLEALRESTYLTDVHDPFIANLLMGHNPQVDARAWALEASPYAWRVGANALDTPARSSGVDARRRAYGRAWRALGETMHLLADMTVPAHVRNDAHPGGWAGVVGALGPDPYEAYLTESVVAREADTEAPRKLREAVKRASTPSALFHEVAAFTNRGYFSKDTIAGTDAGTRMRLGNANLQPAYPAPRLDDLRYAGEDGRTGFYTSAGGTEILVRRPDGSHVLSDDALATQAAELVPSAIEAGVRLLHLCIPRYRVEITGYDASRGTLTVRAVRLRTDDAGRTAEDPLPCDPSSSASVVLFADGGGQRRTVAAPATRSLGRRARPDRRRDDRPPPAGARPVEGPRGTHRGLRGRTRRRGDLGPLRAVPHAVADVHADVGPPAATAPDARRAASAPACRSPARPRRRRSPRHPRPVVTATTRRPADNASSRASSSRCSARPRATRMRRRPTVSRSWCRSGT